LVGHEGVLWRCEFKGGGVRFAHFGNAKASEGAEVAKRLKDYDERSESLHKLIYNSSDTGLYKGFIEVNEQS
jgi:hypothetical protein